MRIFAILIALLATPLVLNAQAPAAPANTVRINNFANYIAPSVLTDFETKTGMKVVYDTFDSIDTVSCYEPVSTQVAVDKVFHELIAVRRRAEVVHGVAVVREWIDWGFCHQLELLDAGFKA